MKRVIFLLMLFSGISAFGQAPVFEWARQMGGGGQDIGNATVADASGNVYTIGYFDGTVDFNPGIGVFNLTATSGYDVFILKLDALGNFVFAKKIGGLDDDYGYAIAIDALGNIYTTGVFGGTVDFDPGSGVVNLTSAGTWDVFVSKLDVLGNFVWAKRMGGLSNDDAYSIVLDTFGNVYTCGSFYGVADFNPGAGIYNLTSSAGSFKSSKDVFISKLDVSGNFVWAKSIGDTLSDLAKGIDVDEWNNVYVTGAFQGLVDFNPGLGTYTLSSVGVNYSDIFILKLDSSGNFVWVKKAGGASSDIGNSIKVDALSNIYSTGSFQDTADFNPGPGTFNLNSNGVADVFILKLDLFGNFIWVKNLGGVYYEQGNSIALDSISNVYTTGEFHLTVDFDPNAGVSNLTSMGYDDVFILKLDSAGNFKWAKNIGGTKPFVISYGNSIDVGVGGDIYTTGAFQDTVDFNPDGGIANLYSLGYEDIFVHKMSQPPVGIQEYNSNNNNSIFLFPNPATNNLTIETKKSTTILIVDLLGQELFNSKIEKSETIDVSLLANGIYFVKDLKNGGSVKFVKQ